jgi:copper chaperone CopZ
MKTLAFSLAVALGLPLSALAADITAEITHVHLCCQGCIKGVEKAIGKVDGAKVAVDQDAGKVTLTGPDLATVQKAADALVADGYFGKSSGARVKLHAATGAKGQKVQSLKVEGVHLCCGKCVKAVDQALKTVPGVQTHNATKGAKVFEVSGDFNDKEVFQALEKEGLAGKIAE